MNTIKLAEIFCVVQKNCRTISQYNLVTKKIKFQDFESKLPHNYQMMQVGAAASPRIFIIGGGDILKD